MLTLASGANGHTRQNKVRSHLTIITAGRLTPSSNMFHTTASDCVTTTVAQRQVFALLLRGNVSEAVSTT